MYKNYGQKVEGNVPDYSWDAAYDSYINERERQHLESLDYGDDEQSLRYAESGAAYEAMIDAWAYEPESSSTWGSNLFS